MADDKDKKKYSYRPEIEYQDTYESEHLDQGYESVNADSSIYDTDSSEVIDNISNTFNDVTKIIQLLPAQLQTAINSVYKPVLDTWSSMGNISYPYTIPDPDKPNYIIPETIPLPDPVPVKPIIPVPPDFPEPTEPGGGGGGYVIDNDGIWDPDIPVYIQFDPVDPIEIIDKEYIRNISDLFNFYVNRLKDILYHYYSEKVAAMFDKKMVDGKPVDKTKNEIAFLFTPITANCKDVDKNNKHLFDASLAMGEHTLMKLNFMENAFPVDQTLFQLKNFKTIYLLRRRYAEIESTDASNKINAMSNNILKGMRTSYEQKYDVAFGNLYKYINSSLDILEDVLNTELAGLRAKRTLVEKGGIK